MTVSGNDRDFSQAVVRQYLRLTGVEQMDIGPADAAGDGWTRYARCGPWHPDAPHPELFFPVSADTPETYKARELCARCPVREWCDAVADENALPGVRAGIFRDDRGRVAPLCATPGCLHYRRGGKRLCYDCIRAEVREGALARKRAKRLAARLAAQDSALAVTGAA